MVGEDEMVDPERKRCPVGKVIKAGMSTDSYLDFKLKPCDEAGFAATGVLLFFFFITLKPSVE